MISTTYLNCHIMLEYFWIICYNNHAARYNLLSPVTLRVVGRGFQQRHTKILWSQGINQDAFITLKNDFSYHYHVKYFRRLRVELLMWITALGYLFFINPSSEHYSFCLFKWFGLWYCPGCGTGHSICFVLHVDINESFHALY